MANYTTKSFRMLNLQTFLKLPPCWCRIQQGIQQTSFELSKKSFFIQVLLFWLESEFNGTEFHSIRKRGNIRSFVPWILKLLISWLYISIMYVRIWPLLIHFKHFGRHITTIFIFVFMIALFFIFFSFIIPNVRKPKVSPLLSRNYELIMLKSEITIY